VADALLVPLRVAAEVPLLLLVGEDEADPSRQTISHVSPLARALVNKVVGDVVEVNSGDVEVVEIL
jgi:transcription elongation GreA/GreB family factor